MPLTPESPSAVRKLPNGNKLEIVVDAVEPLEQQFATLEATIRALT
jgi:hypothetical protein